MALKEDKISDPLEEQETAPTESESASTEIAEETSESRSETERLLEERDEYRDLLQRKQAEFENFRRRVARERDELRHQAQAEVVQDLLPVIDACEKGLESLDSDSSSLTDSYREGYELLLKQLHGVLEKYNVAAVPGVGATFDPNVHEAVIRELSKDYEEGEVIEEYRKGYSMGERLVRPAQVKVSVWPDD